MSELDAVHEALERLEWQDDRRERPMGVRLRAFTRRAALTGGAAGAAALLLEACGSSASSSSANSASDVFNPSKSTYHFTFVNHVTTSPFFVPTQYGAQDACELLGCSYTWTGSRTLNVSQMVGAVNSAVSSRSDGIAVSLVHPTAFNAPVQSALTEGIPVVAYNADTVGNPRLAYIGQDLLVSGQRMGERIAALVPSGDVALFIASPGALNLQPRLAGALATLAGHPSIRPHVVATGVAPATERGTIESYAHAHPKTAGMFAVDAGSTQSVAVTIQQLRLRAKGWKGGGYDLLGPTMQLLAAGQIDFTIDQQPYLQGFFPVIEMYLYQASGGLTGMADIDTGLRFLDKATVVPYNDTKSRYEGSSSAAGVARA
jgi:simple sugar transport system substrate-binding protein